MNNDGHERSLLRKIHTELDKMADKKMADTICQAVVVLQNTFDI